MTDEGRPPVAIRVVRPYSSEDEFLDRELECIARSGIVLVGAQQRPDGTVLRFELSLSDGAVIMRGEGRVVGFKAKAFGDAPGLALRFTRLDVRSKALADRAQVMREQRGISKTGDRPSGAPASGPTSARPSVRPSLSPLSGSAVTPSSARALAPSAQGSTPRKTPTQPPPLPSHRPKSSPPPKPTGAEIAATMGLASVNPEETYVNRGASPVDGAGPKPVPPPPRRDELLGRLRERAKSLDPDRVNAIAPVRPKR